MKGNGIMEKKSKKEEITEALNNISEERIQEIWEMMGIKNGDINAVWERARKKIEETGVIKAEIPPDNFFYNEEDLPDWM